MFRWAARALAEFFKSRASLVAENRCLRQQLLVLQRRHPRPRLTDVDWRFWILARRRFSGWRRSLCSDGRQVHASAAWAKAVSRVAHLSQTARWRNLGLRLHRRADDSLQNALCLLRGPPCQSRSPACPGNSTSRHDGAAGEPTGSLTSTSKGSSTASTTS